MYKTLEVKTLETPGETTFIKKMETFHLAEAIDLLFHTTLAIWVKNVLQKATKA